MNIEIPEQDKLTSQLLNNIGIAIGAETGAVALPTAIAMVRRAYRLNPLDVGRMLNLASLLVRVGEDEEAEHLLTICLKREQSLWLAWQIMGFIRTNADDMIGAVACFKRAYDIDPEHGQRKFDLAAAYLRAGDFARGLPLYEFRHEILPRTSPPPPAPAWDGKKTGHLAVWADQGHGDRIMFARFLPWAKERADKITLLTDPASVSVLFGYSSVCEIACGWDAKKDAFDAQVALGSLPLLYGLTPNNIPPDPGLINAAETNGTLGAPGLKIGIAWYGNPAFPGNDMRTVPFQELLPIASDPRNTVFSLQVGGRSVDIARFRAQRLVHDMSGQIEGDWSHTAAVIKNLDLVVSSCTAVAHFAGAMGVPCFVMLPRFADWRWLHGRDDTPWYPHTRLFRQARTGQWTDVVKRVCSAVDQVHDRRALGAMLARAHFVAAAAPPYEPDVTAVINKVLRPGDTFIDVGANAGIHTVRAAKIVGQTGMVIAFEPGINVLPILRDNTKNLPYVEIVDRPLWNVAGPVTFFLNADNSGGNALWDPADWPGPHNPKSKENPQPVAMEATTLDIEMRRHPRVRSVRLIKIDTEGADQRVLEGAKGLLEHQRPDFIVTEVHEFGLDKLGCSQESLRDFMLGHGYRMFALAADGSTPRLIGVDGKIVGPKNCLFVTNVLFSTERAVKEIWPEAPERADGVEVHGYRLSAA